MKNIEKWIPLYIENTKTRYLISNKGRVKNVITNNILSNSVSDGYLRISLKGPRNYHQYNIATLMLENFKNIKKTDGLYLYFYDGNRFNLDISNIDYLTMDEICDLNYNKLFIYKNNKYYLKDGNEDNEHWIRICIDNIPFHYAISSHGRIINILSSMMIHPTIPKNDTYPYVILRHKGKSYRITMHRIVAELFVDNKDPEKFNIVNHLNENKKDFNSDNLEWSNSRLNTLYSLNSGTNKNKGETAKNATINNNTAIKICEMLEEGYRICEIVSTLGVSRNIIRHIKEGKTWKDISKHYNFKSSFKSYISKEEKSNILKLKKSGKSYEEIIEITGYSKDTIYNIINNDITENQSIITSEIKTRNEINVIKLFNYNIPIEEISDILGLKYEKVSSILYLNKLIS